VFSFLLSRAISGGVREGQWLPYMKEVLRILKPGSGWAQFIEPKFPFVLCDDNSVPPDAPINKVFDNHLHLMTY